MRRCELLMTGFKHGLKLAHAKTEAIMLTANWVYRHPELFSERGGGVRRIHIKRAVKYLGVSLDSELTFTGHILTRLAATMTSVKALDRLMPNVGCPSVTKRKLLSSVVARRLLYAAPVWATRASKYQINRDMLGRAQRPATLRIITCYRTVSTMAATLLAELPLTDLLARERKTILTRKKGEQGADLSKLASETRMETLVTWQNHWSSETSVVRWTRKILSSVHR